MYDRAGQMIKEIRAYQWDGISPLPENPICTSGSSLQQCYAFYTYRDNGQPSSVTDANGNRTDYFYDGFDRLIKTQFPMPSTPGASNPSDYEAYTYDANGNMTSKRTRIGDTISYSYDTNNRMRTKAPGADKEVTYSYDLMGRQVDVRFTDNSHILDFVYDSLGRLYYEDGPLGRVYSNYDGASNRTRVIYPGSFHVDYGYDNASRVISVVDNNSHISASYTYDALDRRTAANLGSNGYTTYGYEADGALDSLFQNFLSSDDITWTFDYTLANQLSTKTLSNNDYAYQPRAYDRDYGVNGLNQYTSVSEGNGIYALSYDMNGNLVSDGASSYGYDTENRLVSVQGPGTNVSYDYDPLGRLYAKRVNGTIIEKYVHDGDSIIADYSGTNQLIRRYIRGTGADEIVGYLGYSGGSLSARRYVHSDYLGSIIATSNDGGQLVDTYRYSIYGEVDDPSGMPYRFTGRRYDGETNLYYYRARWYSPALGRFMQTDPIGYEDNINWYAYVNNDPVNGIDPTGLCTVTEGQLDECEIIRDENLTEDQNTAADNFIANLVKVGEAIYESGDQELIDAFEAIDTVEFNQSDYKPEANTNFKISKENNSFVISDAKITFNGSALATGGIGNWPIEITGHEVEHLTQRDIRLRSNPYFETGTKNRSLNWLKNLGLLPPNYVSPSAY